MNPYHRIKNTISDFWYNFTCRCQRFKRGWAYGDVWDLDVWFMHTVKPMLIHLRDHGIGIPSEFYVDGENERVNWENTLTEMISCLELMDENAVREHLGISDSDYSFESYQKARDLMEENKDRFFELFSKYFFCLWD